VDQRTSTRQCGRSHGVVEADLQGVVDHIRHDWWLRRWEERLEAGARRRLMRQGRKAGVRETAGQVIQPATGTPPGGVSSPILAHGSRHAALDRWCQRGVKPRGHGEACLRRDAAADVAACQEQAQAARCDQELGPRRGTCGREVAPEKTRVLPCRGPHARGRPSCDCRGVEWRWGTARAGTPHLQRRTARKQRRHSLQQVTAWCRDTCRRRGRDLVRDLHAKRRGYDRDDGGQGHDPSLPQCFHRARRTRCTWLNRRSPRRSSTWPGCIERLRQVPVERPRLVGRPTRRRVPWGAEAGVRQRVCLQSPVREHGTPGSVRGRSGHRPSYRDTCTTPFGAVPCRRNIGLRAYCGIVCIAADRQAKADASLVLLMPVG
jgi:RNA-directed DNA polymerase